MRKPNLNEYNELYGEGILDWLKNKFQPVFKPQLRDPTINPPQVRKFLDMHGNESVVSLKAKRVPVDSAVQSLLNVVSLGALKKAIEQTGYDNIFHLSLVINDKYELDKREVITVRPYTKKINEETIEIPLNNSQLTIRQMMDNTAKFMGQDYGSYDPQSNNCQDLVKSILVSNKLGNGENLRWIKQDALSIFQKLPSFAKRFAKFVSGKLAPYINRVIEGEGQLEPTPRQRLLEKMSELEGNKSKPKNTKTEQKLITDQIARQMIHKFHL